MYQKRLKELFDMLSGAIIALILSPLFILVYFFLLFLFGKENTIFKQRRIGRSSEVFEVIKFQTMSNEKDENGKLLPDADRLTSFGNFLRKTSLDELPQLINVLKGDMSLVGPRPLLPKYLPLYSKEQNRRHEVKPGITGWAQVNGRNNITWAKKFELDVWYVDNQSFWLDIKILWMTLIKVLKRKDITTDDPSQFQPFNGSN